MRIRCALLLTLLAASLSILPAAGALAASLPGSDYAWAQPGTAIATVPFSQPPASIPIAVAPAWAIATSGASVAIPGSDYIWAQPGTSVTDVPYSQPPAWIPAG